MVLNIMFHSLLLEETEFEAVTLPVIVSWTSKNGRVWISITPEPCPQLVLHNSTSVPFVFAQAVGNEMVPLQETEYFEQYLVLPPNCKVYYTFSRQYLKSGSSGAEKMPHLLLTKLPQDVTDLMNFNESSPSMGSSSESASCNGERRNSTENAENIMNERPQLPGAINSCFGGGTSLESGGVPTGTMLVPGKQDC